VAAAAAALLTGCGEDGAPPPADPRVRKLPTATIRVGDLALVVEVANDEAERQRGMQFRSHLEPDEAMLFVFPRPSNLGFWGKNCRVDLDLAYVRADGTVAQTERLQAYNEEPVFSREPVQFALETPAGWMEAHGLEVGARVTIPPEVAGSAAD
jgi:hypothetical protein